jgi:predicted nucleotidyltransferase
VIVGALRQRVGHLAEVLPLVRVGPFGSVADDTHSLATDIDLLVV